jgi:uncharacterized membrane protein (DUF485 family)
MLHSDKKLHKSPARRFMQLLGLLMFAFYFVLGLIIIFWSDFSRYLDISETYRILFGVILIVYSFLRFIRLVQVRGD